MKIAPVSADLLIKIGLFAGAGLLLWYGLHKASAALGSVSLPSLPDAINPASQNNAAYTTVNALGSAVVSDPAGPGKNADGSWTLGGYLYDVTHPAEVAAVNSISQPVFTGGASGEW
jgi:hypothetical protein